MDPNVKTTSDIEEIACFQIKFPNLLVNSNLKGNSSFRIFWNVFDSENSIQKRHFNSS